MHLRTGHDERKNKYYKEWLVPAIELTEWVENEQHRLERGSAAYREILRQNRGRHLKPMLQLTNRQPGTHDTHEWMDRYEVDVDHGIHWMDIIIPVLHSRRVNDLAVPRRYELEYHDHSVLQAPPRGDDNGPGKHK